VVVERKTGWFEAHRNTRVEVGVGGEQVAPAVVVGRV
jgi:hypothetical protein